MPSWQSFKVWSVVLQDEGEVNHQKFDADVGASNVTILVMILMMVVLMMMMSMMSMMSMMMPATNDDTL